jgi:hypothetical protein
METRHLIAAIMQQTTVLIAQLSTAAGIRAPLARIADQVFLDLGRELEAQGVTRKVAADMFGLALRSYQKKIQRLSESKTQRDRTLWELVLERLTKSGGASRKQLAHEFRRENAVDLAAVLKDLTTSGLITATGRGDAAHYQVTSAEVRASVAAESEFDALLHFVWLAVYDHQQVLASELVSKLPFDGDVSKRAISALIDDGRISADSSDLDQALLRCTELRIPVGSEQGWEAAVFDHFRAMANAIGAKLRATGARSDERDLVGGTTLTFSLRAGHPHEQEVYGLLRRVRDDVHAVWDRVHAHNLQHPIPPDERVEVTFYFGQHAQLDERSDREEAS